MQRVFGPRFASGTPSSGLTKIGSFRTTVGRRYALPETRNLRSRGRKSQGERYFVLYRADDRARRGEAGARDKLRRALERDEFILHSSRKWIWSVDASSGQALIRWQSPELAWCRPLQFHSAAGTRSG